MCDLLDRVSAATGFDAVAISRGRPVTGALCKAARRSDCARRVVPFTDIKKCLALAYKDNFFILGDQVLMRKECWPMGGPLSEPGTLIDLSENLRLLDCNPQLLLELGWHFDGKCFQDIVSVCCTWTTGLFSVRCFAQNA